MGEKARLRAELIEAQQQRDRAYAARDQAIAEMNAAILRAAREAQRPTVAGRVRGWLDDLGRALGL